MTRNTRCQRRKWLTLELTYKRHATVFTNGGVPSRRCVLDYLDNGGTTGKRDRSQLLFTNGPNHLSLSCHFRWQDGSDTASQDVGSREEPVGGAVAGVTHRSGRRFSAISVSLGNVHNYYTITLPFVIDRILLPGLYGPPPSFFTPRPTPSVLPPPLHPSRVFFFDLLLLLSCLVPVFHPIFLSSLPPSFFARVPLIPYLP